MALRDKLTANVQKLLPEGQQLRHVFMTQSGMSPYSPIGGLIGAFIRKYWVVGVTDTEFVLCKAGLFSATKPKAVTSTEPRRVLNVEGKLWGKAELGGTTHYVHRRFFDDVKAQDGDLGGAPIPSNA